MSRHTDIPWELLERQAFRPHPDPLIREGTFTGSLVDSWAQASFRSCFTSPEEHSFQQGRETLFRKWDLSFTLLINISLVKLAHNKLLFLVMKRTSQSANSKPLHFR